MSKFAESIVAAAHITTRRSRNQFFRDCDRWTNRLFKKALITLRQRQEQRQQIAEAYLATVM